MRYLHIDKHEKLKKEVLKTQAKKRVKKRKPTPNLQKQAVAPRPNKLGKPGSTLTTAPMPRNRKNPVFPRKKRKWSDFGKGKGGGGNIAKAS